MASTRDPAQEALRQTEHWYSEWRARRDQMQSEYEAEIRTVESATRRGLAAVEAEYQRDMQIVGASGNESIQMVEEFMSTKKNLKIKELQDQLREKQSKMQKHYEKLLLDHTEKFSEVFRDRMNVVTQYTAQHASPTSRLPPSPGAPATMPVYARPPLGSNGDMRSPVHNHGRQPHQQQQPGSYRSPDYAGYSAQPRPSREEDYARRSSVAAGRPILPDEHSTQVASVRQQPQWSYSPAHSHLVNNHSVDGRPRPPVLPSQQTLLSSTPVWVEPRRVIDPSKTAGSVSAYPRLRFRNMDEFPANSQKAKRKGDAQDDLRGQPPPPKRTRSLGAQPSSDNNQTATPGDKPTGVGPVNPPAPNARPVVKRTIDFNEVYQDGDAEYKHIIVMYPQGDSGGNWYILKCDEHGVHFNTNPLHGAAKHLHSNQHNNMSKEHALAIRELGHLVWDCNKELADKNNDAVKKAFERGYRPFNRNQLSKTERRSMGFAEPEATPASRPHPSAGAQRKKDRVDPAQNASSKEFSGVAYPVDGELYLAYWSKTRIRYAVIVLPWGDLKPSTGMQGTLLGTGLLEKPPKCYTIDRDTREITGWAEGYEDGGLLVTKREFPVMYFDNPQRGSVGWVRAKDLSRFNFEDPDWPSIPYYKDARDRYAAAQPQKFSSYQQMRQYHEAEGLPLKLLSDTREPPPSETPPRISEAQTAAGDGESEPVKDEKRPVLNGDSVKSPQPEGAAEVNDRGGPADVDMPDVSKHDGVGSDHESEPSDLRDSDEDEGIEMAHIESRHTSVSTKGPAGDDGSSAAATSSKPGAAPPAINIMPAEAGATTATRASPEQSRSEDGDKGQNMQANVGASIVLKEAVNGLTGGSTGPASAVRDTEVGSDPRHVSWRVVHSFRRSDRERASESGSLAAGSPAAHGDPTPSQSRSSLHTPDALEAHSEASSAKEGDEHRAIPLSGDSKSPISPEGKEGATIEVAGRVSSKGEQPLQSAAAPQAPVAAPTTSRVSDDSSEIYSPSSPRSPSPTRTPRPMPEPAAASDAFSRTSTPTSLRSDGVAGNDRWRAVRNESTPQAAASQPAPDASPSSPRVSSVPKEPAANEAPEPKAAITSNATPTATSGTSTALAAIQELSVFDIAYYEDDSGGKFQKQKDGPFLRMAVDKVANTCETTAGQSPHVRIDPQAITRVQVDALHDSSGALCMVTLDLKGDVKGPKKQQLVFETSKAMGREEAGRIHARRFCGWAKSSNAEIDYRNNSFNSSRPATGYTRS